MSKKTKVEFIPLIKNCTYHAPTKDKPCKNCNNTGKYKDGYYMVINDKTAWYVSTIK